MNKYLNRVKELRILNNSSGINSGLKFCKVKKILAFIFFLGSFSPYLFSQAITSQLAIAIKNSVEEIENGIPKDTPVTVFDITSNSKYFSDFVADEISDILIRNKILKVVERNKIDAIQGEINFQSSGLVDDETIQAIGHMTGAKYIISGSITDMGNIYKLRIYAINIEHAEREIQITQNLSAYDEQLIYLLTGEKLERPINKVIPDTFTFAKEKNFFLKNFVEGAVSSFIYTIPRNSTIAIMLHNKDVTHNFIRQELRYELLKTERFNIIDFESIDANQNFTVKNMITEYDATNDNGDVIHFTEEICGTSTDEDVDRNSAEYLNADIIITLNLLEYLAWRGKEEDYQDDNIEVAAIEISLQVLSANSLSRIDYAKNEWVYEPKR